MAAVWYYKKFGKTVEHESKGSTDILNFSIDENLENSSHNIIEQDNIDGLKCERTDAGIIIEIKMPQDDDSFSFTQPFVKEDVNYRSAPLDENGWGIDACGGCAHYITGPSVVTVWERGFCHLVQGVVHCESTCDMFAKSLIDNGDEKNG